MVTVKSRRVLALCLLAVLASGAASAQEVKIAIDSDPMGKIDLPGSDIKPPSPIVMPAQGGIDTRQWQCLRACFENSECQAWTYVLPNTVQGPHGNCWLKNKVPPKTNNACCVSGTIGQPSVDRPGSDFHHFDSFLGGDVTPQLCYTACFFSEKCRAWTFVRPNTVQGPKGVCWLKDSVPAAKPNSCCVSGAFEIQVIR